VLGNSGDSRSEYFATEMLPPLAANGQGWLVWSAALRI